MNNCLPKQLLPCNWITGEENRCYPNSLLPGNLWHRSIILSAQITCTMLIIIYSPKIYNLHYSNSPGYQNFFLEFRSSSFRMTFQFRHLQFGAFVSNFYAEFLRIKFKLGRFSRLCFDYFELSFEKKIVIGQWHSFILLKEQLSKFYQQTYSRLKWQCHEIFCHFFISLIQPICALDKQV